MLYCEADLEGWAGVQGNHRREGRKGEGWVSPPDWKMSVDEQLAGMGCPPRARCSGRVRCLAEKASPGHGHEPGLLGCMESARVTRQQAGAAGFLGGISGLTGPGTWGSELAGNMPTKRKIKHM